MVSILPVIILIYVGLVVFFGDKIYFALLHFIAKKKLEKIGYQIEELDFSFEQIVYLVSTPSSNYKLANSDCEYKIEMLNRSILWPALDLIKIVAEAEEDKMNLALIKKDKFPVPILDTLLYHDQISQWEYDLFISYIFSHPRTHKLLLEEVKRTVTK
jgi:hypothetical protein